MKTGSNLLNWKMKSLLLACIVFLNAQFANAQWPHVWDASGTSTYTLTGRVGIGTGVSDASLHINTTSPNYAPEGVSLRIYNSRCTNCVFEVPQGWVPPVPNVMEVFPRTYRLSGGGGEEAYDPIDPAHPYFVISKSGKVGINVQPDENFDFKLNVEGRSNFTDKVVIGDRFLNHNNTVPGNEFKLYVEQGILTEMVRVELKNQWPDYVFNDDYKLQPLSDVEKYIQENKHLPGVPSASEVSAQGIDLGKMDATLLQKIEELTLHMIELKKENESLRTRVEQLEK